MQDRLLQRFGRCSSTPLGICRQEVRALATRGRTLSRCSLCRLWNSFLRRVRSSGTAPLAWHHTSGAPLHMSNKAGPMGKESGGRVTFFKVLLRTKRDMWSPLAPADWLHGYIAGRRRESAVLIRQVTTWRLERLGMKSLTAFHDLTNAFGSVRWEAMDRAAARLLGPNCLLGEQRYRLATPTIPGMDGDWVAFLPDDSLAACCGRRVGRSQDNCLHGILGWVEVLTFHYHSMQTTQPNRLLLSLERMSRLAKRVRCSNDVLTEHWRLMVSRRTEGKRSSSCTCLERVRSQIAAVRDGKVSLPGKGRHTCEARG